MSEPPEDAPPPSEQSAIEADAGFEPSPTGASLCGFGLPGFNFNISFRIPGFPPAFPPSFNFMIGLNCDLSNPISAEFGFGGGRVGEDDDEFAA